MPTNPIQIATVTLRDTAAVCGACERAVRDWSRRNAWPPKRGDRVPAVAGHDSDPTGQTAVWLASEAERDLADIREARRLITDVYDRRRVRSVHPIVARRCVNPACATDDAPLRQGLCPACYMHRLRHGFDRPERLVRAHLERQVYGSA